MSSLFIRNQRLSDQTDRAYQQFRANSWDVEMGVEFYCLCLQDIAPQGLTVEHIPVAPHDRERAPRREEILLTTSSGKIFMSGLISLEDNHSILERTAGWEAYTYWLDGEFAPNRDNWRFFTGHARKIKFFSSRDRVEWAAEEAFLLVQDVEDVAIFLQQEFDKLSQQERFR